jgi:hypothetical protein
VYKFVSRQWLRQRGSTSKGLYFSIRVRVSVVIGSVVIGSVMVVLLEF